MLAYHRRLAEISLSAVERFGFVLAGGYAISAHGIGDRPSMDVDLFTVVADASQFTRAMDALEEALGAAGLEVTRTRVRPLFADLEVRDHRTGEVSDLQLGMNYRGFPPHRVEFGPVLDVRDAVAGKMSALWSRGEARDFIDIDAVLGSGRFTPEQVLELADAQESTPMDRRLLASQMRAAARWAAHEYGRYGVEPAQRDRIVARFAEWADQIDPAAPVAPFERVEPPVPRPRRDAPTTDPGQGRGR